MSVAVSQKSSAAANRGARKETVGSVTMEKDLADQVEEKIDPSPKQESRSASFVTHPADWNFSPFIKDKEYVPILKDDYPRSEYTMMPMTGTATKFYDGRHLRYIFLCQAWLAEG